MPIYEYCCRKCRSRFEAIVFRPADELLVCCPECKGTDVERQLSCFSTSTASHTTGGSQCAPKPGRRFG